MAGNHTPCKQQESFGKQRKAETLDWQEATYFEEIGVLEVDKDRWENAGIFSLH